jgi:hypothetical protein
VIHVEAGFGFGGQFWRIAEDTERNTAAIKELRQELREMGQLVNWLAFELRRLKENEAHEREKVSLSLQNELLRFERRLPPHRRG